MPGANFSVPGRVFPCSPPTLPGRLPWGGEGGGCRGSSPAIVQVVACGKGGLSPMERGCFRLASLRGKAGKVNHRSRLRPCPGGQGFSAGHGVPERCGPHRCPRWRTELPAPRAGPCCCLPRPDALLDRGGVGSRGSRALCVAASATFSTRWQLPHIGGPHGDHGVRIVAVNAQSQAFGEERTGSFHTGKGVYNGIRDAGVA